MNIDPRQIIPMIKNGINPQQLVMGFLQQSGNNNPILQNVTQLAQNNNISALEMVARNVASQKGLDFNQALSDFKKMF